MSTPYYAKIGYVRIARPNGGEACLFSYEELLLDRRTRQAAAYQLAMTRGKAACCCRTDNEAELRIMANGDIQFLRPEMHTKECREYLGGLRTYIDNTFLKCFSDELNIPVDFSCSFNAKPSMNAAHREQLDATAGKKVTFAKWVLINNALTFSRRAKSVKYPVRAYGEDLCDRFMADIEKETFEWVSPKKREVQKPTGEFLYRDKMESGTQGLYYGRIIDMPAKYNSGKGPNAYIRVTRMVKNGFAEGEKDIFLRVNKKEFLMAYNALPDKEYACVCGFIKARNVLLDAADVNIAPGVGSINGGHVSRNIPEVEGVTKRILEMRCGLLFTCTKSGLAVFDKEELARANEAIEKGLSVYRTLFTENGIRFGLNASVPDGDDYMIGGVSQ